VSEVRLQQRHPADLEFLFKCIFVHRQRQAAEVETILTEEEGDAEKSAAAAERSRSERVGRSSVTSELQQRQRAAIVSSMRV
jgi:hypothetical protein